jgi:hypothetical protein
MPANRALAVSIRFLLLFLDMMMGLNVVERGIGEGRKTAALYRKSLELQGRGPRIVD